MTTVAAGLGNIGGLVIDRRTNHIYWNDGFDINRSNLDGSDITRLFHFPPESFRGDITIDPLRNHLYFVDGRNNIIYRSDMDGSNAIAVVPARGTPNNTTGLSDLWLDPVSEKLYWNYDGAFHRTNLDGSAEEVLFNASPGLDISFVGIGDFEIDPFQGKIYWAHHKMLSGDSSVRRANLDGSQQETLVSGLWWANGVALDLPRGKMYFTDSAYIGPTDYDATIRIANLDGSAAQTLINLGPSSIVQPSEITLDTLIIPEPATALLVIISLLCISYRSHFQRSAKMAFRSSSD
jgi:hypothetical protein